MLPLLLATLSLGTAPLPPQLLQQLQQTRACC
jgi:hypothetical protein